MITNDPKILVIAFLGGLVPSLLWLWFWLKEDRTDPEPKGLLTIIFIMGMLAVVCVLPIQKFIQSYFVSSNAELIFWAMSEELLKFMAVFILIYKTKHDDEPIDWPIYLITSALGFAALENTLFLLKPLSVGKTTAGLLTGQMRFLGSTLLHAVSSGILGVAMGISLHKGIFTKKLYFLVGLILATALHSVFNFFIIKNSGTDFLKVFGFLWVVTIIVILLFEKVRRMN